MLDPSPALGGMSFRLRRFQMPMEGAEGHSGSGCSRPLPAVTAFNLVQLPTSDLWRALYHLRCGLVCMKVYMYSVDIYMYLTKHKKKTYISDKAGRVSSYFRLWASRAAKCERSKPGSRLICSWACLVSVCVWARARVVHHNRSDPGTHRTLSCCQRQQARNTSLDSPRPPTAPYRPAPPSSTARCPAPSAPGCA